MMLQNTLENTDYKWQKEIFYCGDTIVADPDILWLIYQGAVKTSTWDEKGRTIILGYWVAGDVVGQPLSRIDPYEIKCLTYVETARVPLQYWHYLATEIRFHHHDTEELLRIFRQKTLYEKTTQLLIFLAHKFGVEREQGRLIQIPLTHQELAYFLGGTRVTITRIINQLEQEKLINRPDRSYIILSPMLYRSTGIYC